MTAGVSPTLAGWHRLQPPSELLLLRDVVARRDERVVLDGVMLAIPRGRVTALLGSPGAGKSLCVDHILGLSEPEAGEVCDIGALAHRRAVSVLPQRTETGYGLSGAATLHRNVALALRGNGASADRQNALAIRWLGYVGLDAYRTALPHDVSDRMRKRAALARALAPAASLVILDDFDGGLDRHWLTPMCELLRQVQEERGCTVLLTTRNAAVAAEVADRVALLDRGRIVHLHPAEALNREPPVEHEAGPDRPPLADGTRRRLVLRVLVPVVVLAVLIALIVAWLIPILHGDVSLNPYNQ